jgi:hypothetical protein
MSYPDSPEQALQWEANAKALAADRDEFLEWHQKRMKQIREAIALVKEKKQ